MAPTGLFSGGAIRVMARLFCLLQVLAISCAWFLMVLVGFSDHHSSSPVVWGMTYGVVAVFWMWLLPTPVLPALMLLTWIASVVTRRRCRGVDAA